MMHERIQKKVSKFIFVIKWQEQNLKCRQAQKETYHNILFLHNFVECIYVWNCLKVLVGLLIATFFDPQQKLA